MWYSGDDPIARECGIHALIAARGDEEPVGRVVAQPIIDGELFRGAPGILRVEAKPLNILRKAAIARARRLPSRSEVRLELRLIGQIKRRVLRKRDHRFL